eukprot:TRINITY_DN47176_c0_g1_i6.p1 TRINITY_DN47176_c0_g1~~TRINITY_DN47176_c0_g1_i6.p1  ORF type:complete len:145 (-),score=16.45 TRINITY_DN47176_c0_g1_i6:12-446(-)
MSVPVGGGVSLLLDPESSLTYSIWIATNIGKVAADTMAENETIVITGPPSVLRTKLNEVKLLLPLSPSDLYFGRVAIRFQLQGQGISSLAVVGVDVLPVNYPPTISLAANPQSVLAQQFTTLLPKIGRAVQQECRDRSRMPSSA